MCGRAVNTSNSGSGGLGSSLARRIVSLDEECYSTLSLFAQVYKWEQVTYCWGVPYDGQVSCPGGSNNTPKLASCYGNRYKLRSCGPLAHVRLYLTYLTCLLTCLSGYFWVPKTVTFKTRLSAKPFLWKWASTSLALHADVLRSSSRVPLWGSNAWRTPKNVCVGG